jgi:transposase
MPRHQLSDAQFARIEPLLPKNRPHRPGRPWKDHHTVLNGILWILHTGAPWRDLPEPYQPWQTVYGRFNRWRHDGTWDKILTRLLDRLDDGGRISHRLWCIDASIVRGSRAAAGARKTAAGPRVLSGRKGTRLEEPADHALGRSQGGFGTKVHLVCDAGGIPLALHVTPGQRHESTVFEVVLDRVWLRRRNGRPCRPQAVAGDKGYSFPRIRRWPRRRQIEAVIPTRDDQPRDAAFDKASYRQRNIIERVVNWFKERRRLGTRYEKLAINFVAFWMVAMIEKALGFSL